MLPLYPQTKSTAERNDRVDVILKQVALSSLGQSPVSTLSGGERQRCALARALVSSPSYLFADEPTAHMDASGVDLVVDLLGMHKRKGVTQVVVSHDPRLDENDLFDHCYRLESGRLEKTS